MDPTDKLTELARIERLRVSGEARLIRARAGISARQLAKALGVRPQTVLSWEEAETRPRPVVALRWLRALDRLKAEMDRPAEEEPPELALTMEGAA